jgi:cysteine desulfurase
VFTSGGTEANNQVIKGLFFASPHKRPFHLITSCIEHPAVLEPCGFLETLGAEVTRLAVDRHGLVDPDDVRRAIRPGTALVSIMHANNEIGTIQPVDEIAAIAREHDIVMHTDAAQTVGKLPVRVESLGVGCLSVAGHKLYGPKGVGVLYVCGGIRLAPLMHGAGHESGRRAGTENVAQIAALGAACAVAQQWIDDTSIAALRDEFWRSLQATFGDRIVLNGHPTRRLPNTLHVSFLGESGSEILAAIPQIAASTGAACHAGSVHTSPVLAAMQLAPNIASGAIRFSLGRGTTRDEIETVVELLRRHLIGHG